MKNVVIILLFSVIPLLAQKAVVVEDVALTNRTEGKFYFPTSSPDGSGILYSTENYQGLWYKNLSSRKAIKITDALGAGYEPGFTQNGKIVFKADKYVKGKKYADLMTYDLNNKNGIVIEHDMRDLKLCRSTGNISNSYSKETEIRLIDKQKSLQKVNSNELIILIENSKIAVYENNNKRFLEPLGEGQYIWASLSPDKTKLLFTLAGKGTYVTNLEGIVLKKIGYANYPSWSPDGNWILFMKDIDDGVKLISSDIYVVDLIKGNYFNLTLTKDNISLYPQWGNVNTEIFYNTINGQIRKIKLKYE